MANENKKGGWLYIPVTDFHPQTLSIPSVSEKVSSPGSDKVLYRIYRFEKGKAQRVTTDEDFETFQGIMTNVPGRPKARQVVQVPMFETGRPDTDKPLDLTSPTVLAQLKEMLENGQLGAGRDESESDIDVDIGKPKQSVGITTETVGADGMIDRKDK